MYELKTPPHPERPGVKIFEVWRGGTFVAAVYPTEQGLKIVSKYLTGREEASISIDRQPPPAILIDFGL